MTLAKITPAEFDEKLQNQEKIVLLDVRAEEKFNDFHIEASCIESLNIPKNLIFNLSEDEVPVELPNGKEIFVTCTTGNSAAKCAKILSERNYNVILLEGGITAWKEYLQTKNK